MSTATNPTRIEIDEVVPAIHLVREFDFPVAKVFRAHAEADLVARWLKPRDMEMEVETFDFRTGGSYRYHHGTTEGMVTFRGCFHEVRPDELIIQTFTFEEMPDGVALERLVFDDLGDGRSRLTSTTLVDSFEGRDAFVASGMADGVDECYEQIDDLLAEGI